MSQHFTLGSLEGLSFEQEYETNIKDKIILPKNLGYFNMKNSKITDDIFLLKMDHQFTRGITFDYDIENIFYINILLEGEYEIKSSDKKTTMNIDQGRTITSFLNKDKGINKKSDVTFKSIGLAIKGEFLKKHFLNKLEDQKNIKNQATTIFKNELTNIKTQMCANELFYM